MFIKTYCDNGVEAIKSEDIVRVRLEGNDDEPLVIIAITKSESEHIIQAFCLKEQSKECERELPESFITVLSSRREVRRVAEKSFSVFLGRLDYKN